MKKPCFLLFLSFTIFASSAYTQPYKFQILGKTTGFPDSTLLYLEDASGGSSVHNDSARIINNQFNFSGTLQSESEPVFVRTNGDHKYFWLEGSTITFQAEKGKFRDAIITGSKTQGLQDQLDADIKKTGNEKEQSILFIQDHPNSILSGDILNSHVFAWGKDTSVMLYRHLSANMKNTRDGKNVLAFINLNKNIKVGDRYADFAEPDIHGKTVSLSDFKGKVTLLEFWASWCGPCRRDNPQLVKIYNEFKNKGFAILGVSADDQKNDWIDAVQKDSLVWQNVSDMLGDKNKAVLIYGISEFPANFLIDRRGYIIAKNLRGEDLGKKLSEILN